MISTFTKSPQPIALLSLAIRTASSALRAPDVFGSSVTPSGMKSRIFSFSWVFARLSASVMISAPPCSTAALIRFRLYFPDPRIKRLLNSFPPNTNLSSMSTPLFFHVLCVLCFFYLFCMISCSTWLASCAAHADTLGAISPIPSPTSVF